MNRKLIAFSMTFALAFSIISTAIVGAHTVSVEAPTQNPTRTDWFGVEPAGGIGAVQRNTAQQGEYVFNDAIRDQRQLPSATKAVTREADLDWFSVTADSANLYLLTKVENYCCLTTNPALEVMVSIDTNPVTPGNTGTGTRALPDVTQSPSLGASVGISVTQDAAWEYVIDARFSPSSGGSTAPKYLLATPRKYMALNTAPACTGCKAQLVGATLTKGSFVEMAIPWGQIGGAPAPSAANGFNDSLRFTVSTYYSNHATPVVGTPPVIDVLDSTVDSLKQPGEQIATDKVIKTSVDVHFDSTAANEVFAPLQITEFQANPVGKDDPTTASAGDSEWVEIYNPNAYQVTLSNYKIGNAAQPGGSSQGMFKFKTASIAGQAVAVVARSKSKFLAAHPGYAGTVYDLSSTAQFSRYDPWATGSVVDLANGPSGATATTFEEQILLLDAKDGVVDMVTYGNPTKPTAGNVPISLPAVPDPSSLADEVSYERCPYNLDTNGGFDALNPATNNTDFVQRLGVGTGADNETPGQLCLGVPGIDMSIIQSAPSSIGAGEKLPITLTYSNIGSNNEPAGTVLITETLPVEVTFPTTPGAGDATVAPLSVSPDGRTIVWQVPAPAANNSVVGTITFTPTVKSPLPGNTPLLLTATIKSKNEQSSKLVNNTASTTVFTLGPAVLGLNVLGQPTAPAGKNFQITIGYSNSGQDDAADTTVTLKLPANATLLSTSSATAAPNFTIPAGGIVGPATLTWNTGTLPTNTSGTISIVGKVNNNAPSGSNLLFQVSASGTSGTGVVTANSSTTLRVDIIKVFLPMVKK